MISSILRFIRRNGQRLEDATGNNGLVGEGLLFLSIILSITGGLLAISSGGPVFNWITVTGVVASVLGLILNTGKHSDYNY